MIKVLIVRYGIMQIERANMLKSKILNIVYGVLFGLLSYVIITVMTVVFQQNDLSIWLSNFSFFFLKKDNSGYFVKIDFLNDNLMWVIFSTKFLLFDIKSKTVIKEFPLKYCFDVCCDKNRIFFGTWEGLYMEEASFDL